MRFALMMAVAFMVAVSPAVNVAARELQTVPQGGAKAAALQTILRTIHLPPGFRIDLYALTPHARSLAVGPQDGVVFVGTRTTDVYALTDRAHAGVADRVSVFAPDADFRDPNGVCFARDGTLYVAEQNRVRAFPEAGRATESITAVARTVVPEGGLIPVSEQAVNHGARYCRIGPDDRLYIAIGQPYNVSPKAKQALYLKLGLGSIVRMDRDGANREIFAAGIRNSVGLDFNPANHELWFTDNQVDGMGDDQPPGELNRAPRAGLNFGFPWYGGGHTRTLDYLDQTPPPDLVFPEVQMVAHAADLGMVFYRGHMFPQHYRGAIFSAQHGSWDRSVPIGARVMATFLKPDGTADHTEPFAEGWLDDASGKYRGRPVDVAELPDGSLLVSDDFAGAVYRITYGGS